MSMFSNPFNSKVVSDITKFLHEHRNDLDIDPCLNEKAKEAVDQVENTTILEERRRVLTSLFNEAISACGCKGTNKEANAFGKAVEMHTEEKKKSLPPAFLKNIQKKKDAAKKEEFEEDEEDELDEAKKSPSEKLQRFVGMNMSSPMVNKADWTDSYMEVNKSGKIVGILDNSELDGKHGYVAVYWNPTKKKVMLGNQEEHSDAWARRSEVKENFQDVDEANQRLRKPKPHEEVYYKWFDGVPVSIMDMTKIAKEIQAALDSKADLKKVMPELVKKYRKD